MYVSAVFLSAEQLHFFALYVSRAHNYILLYFLVLPRNLISVIIFPLFLVPELFSGILSLRLFSRILSCSHRPSSIPAKFDLAFVRPH